MLQDWGCGNAQAGPANSSGRGEQKDYDHDLTASCPAAQAHGSSSLQTSPAYSEVPGGAEHGAQGLRAPLSALHRSRPWLSLSLSPCRSKGCSLSCDHYISLLVCICVLYESTRCVCVCVTWCGQVSGAEDSLGLRCTTGYSPMHLF